MLFHFFYQWASLLALLGSAAVALWRGGWPERLGGGAMILAWAATTLLYNSIQQQGLQIAPNSAAVPKRWAGMPWRRRSAKAFRSRQRANCSCKRARRARPPRGPPPGASWRTRS